MTKPIKIKVPSEEELKKIEESWLVDYDQKKQSLIDWFIEKLLSSS